MSVHSDGHTLDIELRDSDVTLVVNCPYDGQSFNYGDAPPCRQQDEGGDIGFGHYRLEVCGLVDQLHELGTEAIELPRNQVFKVSQVPMPISWSTGKQWFSVIPTAPEATEVPA